MSNEKRIPSRIVSALLRLERAGDEHSKTTQRLCDAAWLVADLVRQKIDGLPNLDDWCGVRPTICLSRAGVCVTLYGPDEDERRYETLAPYGAAACPTREAALALAKEISAGWLDDVANWLAARATEDRSAIAVLDAAAERLQPDAGEMPPQRLAVSPTPGSLGFTADEILAAMDAMPRPPVVLRERGIYLLPGGGEAIACQRFVRGDAAGWSLYNCREWQTERPAELVAELDGSVANVLGYECIWTLADLVDTGRTMHPETDRLGD